jgi:hypothetical protein
MVIKSWMNMEQALVSTESLQMRKTEKSLSFLISRNASPLSRLLGMPSDVHSPALLRVPIEKTHYHR